MYRGMLAVSMASLLVGCSLIQTPYGVKNPVIEGDLEKKNTGEQTTMLQETAQRWVDAYRGVQESGTDSAKKKAAIYHYVDSGITYSSLLCESYFQKMKYTQAHRGFYQNEANLASGLTSSLMGLAKASAGSIAATGAVFSFGNASFDSYNEAFVFSADLNTLESLVRASQVQQEMLIFKKLHGTATTAPDAVLTLDQAVRELDKYTYICTRGGIVALLNETVNSSVDNVKNSTRAKSESDVSAATLENLPRDALGIPAPPVIQTVTPLVTPVAPTPSANPPEPSP